MNHTFNSEQRNPMTICLVMISHKTENYTTDINCSIVLAINEPLQHGREKIIVDEVVGFWLNVSSTRT